MDTARTDPFFPALHPRPRRGWVNDPNGFGHWDGRWHVMCQHNPHGVVWGDIEWAHLSSPDLVTWIEHPPALRARPGRIDSGGVWSGVALVDEGEPVLVYTAVPEGGAPAARVAIATRAGDGWHQPDRVISPPAPPGVRDVRDPFLFTHQGRRYAIQGGGTDDGVALVLLYDATDMTQWRELGVLLRGDDPVAARLAPGRLWECPQLALVDGTWVLVLSLWDDTVAGCATFGPQGTAWLAGSLTTAQADFPGGLRFVPTTGGAFDTGSCLYAPQLTRDPDTDQVLAIGWAWEGTRSAPPPQLPARDWAGTLTFPRILSWREDTLHSALAPVVLRDLLPPVPDPRGELPVGAWAAVVASPGTGPATIEVVLADRPLLTLIGHEAVLTFDHSVLECFVDGRASTVRVYPEPGQRFRVRVQHEGQDAPA